MWMSCRQPDQRGISKTQVDRIKRWVDDEGTDQKDAGQKENLKLPRTAFSRGGHEGANLLVEFAPSRSGETGDGKQAPPFRHGDQLCNDVVAQTPFDVVNENLLSARRI